MKERKDSFDLYVVVSGMAICLGNGTRLQMIQLKSTFSGHIDKTENTCYVMVDSDGIANPLYDDYFSPSCISDFKNTVTILNKNGIYCTDKKNPVEEFLEQYGTKTKEFHNNLIKSFVNFLESPCDKRKIELLKHSIANFSNVAEIAKCELGVQLTCDIHSEINHDIYSDCMIECKRTNINSCRVMP